MSRFLYLFFVFITMPSAGQCDFPVTHLSGTATVNNISVSVASTGNVSSIYECFNTGPYWIGRNSNFSEAPGSYIFTFDQPIAGVSLNINGLDVQPNGRDEIQISVNGSHYAVQDLGIPNGCWELGQLTAEGYIVGDEVSQHGGCKNTIIYGPIQTLEVHNNNGPQGTAGATFSLYICDDSLGIVDNFQKNETLTIFPNPITTETTVISKKSFNNASLNIVNQMGQVVKSAQNLNGNSITLPCDDLSSGIYYLQLFDNSNIYSPQKLIVR